MSLRTFPSIGTISSRLTVRTRRSDRTINKGNPDASTDVTVMGGKIGATAFRKAAVRAAILKLATKGVSVTFKVRDNAIFRVRGSVISKGKVSAMDASHATSRARETAMAATMGNNRVVHSKAATVL